MAKYSTGHQSKFIPFKRTKPGIGAEHRITIGKKLSADRRFTLSGLNVGSSGTLVHLTDPTLPVRLNVFTYDENSYTEEIYTKVEEIPNISLALTTPMMWINVDGIHYRDIIAQIGQRYNIHPLVQIDITTAEQRTKLDVLEDALFLVCKLIYHDMNGTGHINIEQMCFYLKENLLITFQETPKALFDSIKNSIRQRKGPIRKLKVDYLFYSLVDVIVDHYMDVLETMGTKVESIHNQLINKLKRDTLDSIYDMKHHMLYLHSIIFPLKEIIVKLQKQDQTQIMQESTIIYLKDLFDHVIQVNDSMDTYREMLSSFIDFHMMLNSNAMNDIVKILTMISATFVPLTFITGLYGMNFQNMPEITYKYGYFIILGVLASLAIFMLSCFKRKHWF